MAPNTRSNRPRASRPSTTGMLPASMGILRGLAECRNILLESIHPIIVYSDHKDLLKILSVEGDSTGRIARWIDRLGEYNMKIVHRPGKLRFIGIADGLSRFFGATIDAPERQDEEVLPFKQPIKASPVCLARLRKIEAENPNKER